MQDMTLHSQHPDKWCEDHDDHRPFTTITFQLMMTNDHDHDDDYEIEEDESEEEECGSCTLLCPSLCNLKTKI